MLNLILALLIAAQPDDPPVVASRALQLKLAREHKALNLRKPERTFLENALFQFKERRIIERFQEGFHGLHPILGGLTTVSSLAAGSYFERNGIRTSAQGSLSGYQKYEIEFKLPQLDDKFFTDLKATYRNYPREDFFGIGGNSREENRTSYRLEDTNYTGSVGIKPGKNVTAGVMAGWLQTNTGRGADREFPSIEAVFSDQTAPGLARQPNFLQAGAFLDVDYRDEAGNPRSGGHYVAQWLSNHDRKFGQYDFARYDVELQQYIPFFNKRRVIALRGKTTLTNTAPGQQIPFFMQPTLGGSDDLRGFREFRFQDNNMVVLNAEYRWEAFSGLDLALFMDAGQVAARPSDIDFSDLKKSYGFGVRFNTAKNVFMRVDFGFSNEGRRVFFKFGHVF